MKELIYVIPKEKHEIKSLEEVLSKHPEIKFVSLIGVDLAGNATDEKIPISLFIDDMEDFLKLGIQTDGSSVALQGIATMNNARVDLVPDLNVNWFIDYNYDNVCDESNLPVGTLKIPALLIHNNMQVGSRSILKRANKNFVKNIMEILKQYPNTLRSLGIDSINDIEEISLTSATELEMWVRTPDDRADVEKLAISQMLKEQYWKKTQGTVRTALEKSIELMERYELYPEMGHKEVGGVTSKIGIDGRTNYVMEQIEIDWKYDTTIQAADNELLAREIITDTFNSYGLEVTFRAKPLEGVAGSGEHTHVGVSAKLKNGNPVNLFTSTSPTKDYLSEIGYGALMGILKHYEAINPFISSSNDAFNRLKPGFEAPICVVASLGVSTEIPSRNRSVLVGVIRDLENPLATRFEVRAPNPLSNTYLVLASLYQIMLDGINATAKSGKNTKELEQEISKDAGVQSFYLRKERAYRSENDVFEYYTQEERDRLFGKPPATVWENVNNLDNYEDGVEVLISGDVFSKDIIESFKISTLDKWEMELKNRILEDNIEIIRECEKMHYEANATDLDIVMWEKISDLRYYMMKDSLDKKSLFTRIKNALDAGDYDIASSLQQEMSEKMKGIKELYIEYKRNLFEVE